MNKDKIEKYEDLIFSDKNAESSLLALVSSGDTDAMYVLGIAYYDGDITPLNEERAADLLKQASDSGHIRARHDLACFHYYGYRFPDSFKNHELAAMLFEKNAESNYVPSLVFLSSMYKNGEGVPANSEKSIEYYELAIKYGYEPEIS